MQEMKIIISKEGQVTIDVMGVKGSGCKNLTKALEKAFGRRARDTKPVESKYLRFASQKSNDKARRLHQIR
jgi:hypothetical protein